MPNSVSFRQACMKSARAWGYDRLTFPRERRAADESRVSITNETPFDGNYREVFLRIRAPGGILKSTAVIEAFQGWSKRSGLDIPYKGTHCLRHSYALYLFRRGLPLKTIGDLLGRRTLESTDFDIRISHLAFIFFVSAFEFSPCLCLSVCVRG
jgi:integrase